jgi:hypothetical protein
MTPPRGRACTSSTIESWCGEDGPDVYYRLVSQLEYTAEQLATEEAPASQKRGRCSDRPGPGA